MILKGMQLQELSHTSDFDRKNESVMARHPSVVLVILFGIGSQRLRTQR